MNEYVKAGIYIGLGLVGAIFHYLKKRYVDKTTNYSLWAYLLAEFPSTLRTLVGIALAEVNLSLLQASDVISLTELLGAVTAGYMFDSGLNKA